MPVPERTSSGESHRRGVAASAWLDQSRSLRCHAPRAPPLSRNAPPSRPGVEALALPCVTNSRRFAALAFARPVSSTEPANDRAAALVARGRYDPSSVWGVSSGGLGSGPVERAGQQSALEGRERCLLSCCSTPPVGGVHPRRCPATTPGTRQGTRVRCIRPIRRRSMRSSR